MCQCDCNKIKFTQVLHDCSKVYSGAVPFSIMAVLDADLKILTPKECKESGRGNFNDFGYTQNYYSREFADFEKMYLAKAETLPQKGSTFAIIIVYNNME